MPTDMTVAGLDVAGLTLEQVAELITVHYLAPVTIHHREESVEMNPADAEKLGLADGQKVKLSNSAGAVAGPVKVSGKVPAGLLFVPYHYADLDIQQLISTESNCVAVEATKA